MKLSSAVSAIVVCALVSLTPIIAQEATEPGAPADVPVEDIQDIDITTASDFFADVSDRYTDIEDYQATIIITEFDTIMSGTLAHKRPDMLLIEFDNPENVIISSDGVHLQVYIPYMNVVMEQPLSPHGTTGLAVVGATSQGLELLKSRYTVAYLDSQDYVPLEEGSDEMVRKLRLEWKSIDEGFREIILSINEDLLIRRMEGITAGLDEITFDFLDTIVNPGFPNKKFVWDSPPSAYIIRNFIFEPETTEE